MIQQIIIQDVIDDFYYKYNLNTSISDVIYTGSYGGLVTPKSTFNKGDTYITGVTDESTRNPVIYRYRSSNNSIVGVDVGTIDNIDPLEHQHPAVIIVDDYVYVFMVNGHGEDIKIWKSNTVNIEDGFTLFNTITGTPFTYLNATKKNDDSIYFLSRVGFGGTNEFGHTIGRSNKNDYTTWSVQNITDPNYSTTDNRHYPNIPTPYNNEWYYFCINLRNETNTPEVYFAQAYYKTKDFETYYSLDESFSKNISLSGVITASEVESNLTYIGSTSAESTYVGASLGCVVNDVVYNAYFDVLDYWKFYKIENGIKTEYPCLIPNLNTNSNFSYNIRFKYNGNNLVLIGDRKIWSCNLDFSNLQIIYDYGNDSVSTIADATLLPNNLNLVYGDYIFGGNFDSLGEFPYYVTNDKFIR